MENNSKNSRMIPLLLSFCFVLSYNWYFFRNDLFGIGSMFNILMLGCIYRLICSGMNAERRARCFGSVFGFIFSLALVIGRAIHDNNDITDLYATPEAAAYYLLSLLSFTAVFGLGSALALEAVGKIDDAPAVPQNAKLHPALMFCAIWAFIFLCWLPVYLAYYPGVYNYDMPWQTSQAIGLLPYTKYHPPLHTFFWQLCLTAVNFDYEAGLVLYSILQMLFLSAVFAGAAVFFIRRGIPRIFVIISLLFFAINPAIAIFSFAPTKDVIFCGLLIMFALEMCILASCREKFFASRRHICAFIILGMLACLFRNNCVHAFALSVPVVFVIMKGFRVKALALFTAPIFLFMLINGPVYEGLGVRAGNPREFLSVPIQQIARAAIAAADELSDDDKARIDRFLPFRMLEALYRPGFADPVKTEFEEAAYNEDPSEFWGLWLDLMRRRPADYVSAFLSLNTHFWYPDADMFDEAGNRYLYTFTMITSFKSKDVIERQSFFPALFEVYEGFANFRRFGQYPVAASFFFITLPLWMMLACTFILLYKRACGCVIVVIPFLMLHLTYLAGPLSYFRYVFPMFSAYPLFISLALWPRKMTEQHPENTD